MCLVSNSMLYRWLQYRVIRLAPILSYTAKYSLNAFYSHHSSALFDNFSTAAFITLRVLRKDR